MSTAHARTADPSTSHEAARNIAGLPSELAVLTALADGEATDEQIAERVQAGRLLNGWPNWSPGRLRDARLCLQRRGLVKQVTDADGRPILGLTMRSGKTRKWRLAT
jgi:hypothetical protein